MRLEYCPPRVITSLGAFRDRYRFGPKDNQRYFDQIVKDAKKGQIAIHRLRGEGGEYGFVAISVQCFEGKNTKKCLNIDYLFVSEPYRRDRQIVGDMKLSEYLLSVAIDIGRELSQTVPIDLIGAEPSHENIRSLYTQNGFEALNGYDENVLYFKL